MDMAINGANRFICLKAVTGVVLIKKLFLKISQYSQENMFESLFN